MGFIVTREEISKRPRTFEGDAKALYDNIKFYTGDDPITTKQELLNNLYWADNDNRLVVLTKRPICTNLCNIAYINDYPNNKEGRSNSRFYFCRPKDGQWPS